MRSLFALLLLLCYASSYGQERTVTGRLTDETGQPLPSVTILVKGTTIGTLTDANGNYSIQASIGSILVFRFLGYGSQEVLVTEESLTPVTGKGKKARKKVGKKKKTTAFPPLLLQDSLAQHQPGVASLSSTSASHKIGSVWDIRNIKSIKKTANGYRIKKYVDQYGSGGIRLSYATSIGLEAINRLPDLQSRYAQGRGLQGMLQWRGPDQQEIFSWGPALNTLTFDGTTYPYDKGGRLIETGSGKRANAYDPLSFFRTGHTVVNELSINLPGPASGRLYLDIEHRMKEGIIRTSDYQRTNVSLRLKKYRPFKSVQVGASVIYNQSRGDLLPHGANLSNVIGSVYKTAPTFDNANGLSADAAVSDISSYSLSDGSVRSYAPGLADNPYGLLSGLPDHDKSERLLSSLSLNYRPNSDFSLLFKGSFDLQRSKTIFGAAPGLTPALNGRLTQRKDQQQFASGAMTAQYSPNGAYRSYNIFLTYQTQYFDRQLSRQDAFDFTGSGSFEDITSAAVITDLDESLTRNTHELIFNAAYEHNGINARITNRTYFSNTVDYDGFTNFLPSVSFNLNLADIIYLSDIYDLSAFASLGKSLREAPLLYHNWSYGSTALPIDEFAAFYESNELIFNGPAVPETEVSFEVGARIELNRLEFEATYFNNTTNDFLAPTNTSGQFALNNLAQIKNTGATLSLSYRPYLRHGSLSSKLNWSTYDTRVKELYGPDELVALAGFSTVQTALAEGQPVGAIYGSTYSRNEEGERIVGNDGFPIKDSGLTMIGNPIPDWVLGWSTEVRWKQFDLSLTLDFKKGGQVWNGTQAMLDYLGRSSDTEALRNTRSFVFEGVTATGQPNTTPVNFYDPERPLSENRWVRYGWDGIAEAYIENASAFRLSQLMISHTFVTRDKIIREIKVTAIGRNLFLITPYNGVDPASTLFGYSTGSGLDLFNTPSTRSYALQVTIKL